MHWIVKHIDILEEPADVLVCSANPFLTLSGGVGGAFLLRYGDEMQRKLMEFLSGSHRRYVDCGTVVKMPPCGSPYLAVLHAVGVNGFYESSPEVVAAVIRKSLEIAASINACNVALAAIATGYGRLSLEGFADSIRSLMDFRISPITQVAICLECQHQAQELASLLH